MVIPVTEADRKLDKFNSSYVPTNEQDGLTWEHCLSPLSPCLQSSAYNGIDDPEIYHGAPASIQILAGRMEEEKLLAIGQIVADALAKSPN